jgi:hypothetical protein
VRPEVDTSLSFAIDGGRHPVVEQALKRDGQPFIANACDLSPVPPPYPPPQAGEGRVGALIVLLEETWRKGVAKPGRCKARRSKERRTPPLHLNCERLAALVRSRIGFPDAGDAPHPSPLPASARACTHLVRQFDSLLHW